MSQYHIGDALKNLINTSNLKNGMRAAQLETVWEELMGKTIATYTDKIQIINQTLFIYTSVGALKQELLYSKQKIIERVNEAMNEAVISNVVVQ